jgi:hypothetical protein
MDVVKLILLISAVTMGLACAVVAYVLGVREIGLLVGIGIAAAVIEGIAASAVYRVSRANRARRP